MTQDDWCGEVKEAGLVLGLPGPLVSAGDQLDYTATKVGGQPLLPTGAANQFQHGSKVCAVCGSALDLVFQAYAPLSTAVAGRDIHERVLYLFGCTREGCGIEPGCWRAVRVQIPGSQAEGKPVVMTATGQSPSVNDVEFNADDNAGDVAGDWGTGTAGGGQMWGMEGGSEMDWGIGEATVCDRAEVGCRSTGGNAFDFNDLDSALDAMATQASAAVTSSSAPSSGAVASNGLQNGSGAELERLTRVLRLPEFHIYAEQEPCKEAKRMGQDERQHAQKLLATYEGEVEQAKGADTGAAESWAGEAYEEDHTEKIDATAMKFLKRLARSPSQCARYSYRGTVQWPSAGQPEPPPCGACGSARHFEMQLMAPLVHFLDEAATWVQDGDYDTTAMVPPPTSWAWSTIAVFTCAANCSPNDQWVAEEWIALVNE